MIILAQHILVQNSVGEALDCRLQSMAVRHCVRRPRWTHTAMPWTAACGVSKPQQTLSQPGSGACNRPAVLSTILPQSGLPFTMPHHCIWVHPLCHGVHAHYQQLAALHTSFLVTEQQRTAPSGRLASSDAALALSAGPCVTYFMCRAAGHHPQVMGPAVGSDQLSCT